MRDVNKLLLNAVDACLFVSGVLVIIAIFILFVRDAHAEPQDWLKKCEPYEKTVKSILREEGVDQRYYYLMVAESRCTENAVSDMGALGFWQMLKITDRHYGCRDDFNLECQTHAAAKYIRHLSGMFPDFYDVIAAYNIGGHNYKKSGKRTKEAEGLVYSVRKLIELEQCTCKTPESVVVMDNQNKCKYWYYVNEPEKLNPCERIPGNALPVWSEKYNG